MLFFLTPSVHANEMDKQVEAILELSLEEILDYEVTSVAKKRQLAANVATAMHVISQSDIQRSGAQSIPELLRMVPGVNVARINANSWAVSIRGFNGRYARKLLVLMDGRSIYTPLFGGVYWDAHELMLQDVERIEVIRGPGGTIWGSNAVNGVINIITKQASDTQTHLVSTSIGSEQQVNMAYRYGGQMGSNGHYRVYAKGVKWDDSLTASGTEQRDAWHSGKVGFRADISPTHNQTLQLQAELSSGAIDGVSSLNSFNANPTEYSDTDKIYGSHLLAKWTQRTEEGSQFALLGYVDHAERISPYLHDQRTTFNVEFNHLAPLGKRHELNWGGGVRYIADEIRTHSNYSLQFSDPASDHIVTHLFVQDEMSFPDKNVSVTLGTKLEHNPYTGLEIQPSLRATWKPTKTHTVWGAVSRAVHTPSRFERDGKIEVMSVAGTMPFVMKLSANDQVDSETVNALEIGHRSVLSPTLSMDSTIFFNVYDNLLGYSSSGTSVSMINFTPTLYLPASFVSMGTGESFGFETALKWQPTDDLEFQFAYSYLNLQIHTPIHFENDGSDYNQNAETQSPRNQVSIRGSYAINEAWHWDAWIRYTDALYSLGIPAYTNLDMQLKWQPKEHITLSLIGHNLLEPAHAEGKSEFFSLPASEIERSVLLNLSWTF
uniref:Putative TonB-dependent receptor n=1 Tax=Magnetococcus massalia (strain MO-1) TaxID=451514 RepID=A0A1S7LHW6_MAGMO|nr:putative TonB-dependent receptor [Candidatus Magnetococcus massalia]